MNFNDQVWNAAIKALCAIPGIKFGESLKEIDKAVQHFNDARKDSGDLINPLGLKIFNEIVLLPGTEPRFPTDPLEKNAPSAYCISGDNGTSTSLMGGHVHMSKFTNNIDWDQDYTDNQRFDVLARAVNVMVDSIKKKIARAQLNLLMRPNWRTSSLKLGYLAETTDMIVKSELMAAVKQKIIESCKCKQEDEAELWESEHVTFAGINWHEFEDISNVFSENIDREEYGVGKKQICIALNLKHNDNFVMPWSNPECYVDASKLLKDKKRHGLHIEVPIGMACFDSRCVKVFEESDVEKYLDRHTANLVAPDETPSKATIEKLINIPKNSNFAEGDEVIIKFDNFAQQLQKMNDDICAAMGIPASVMEKIDKSKQVASAAGKLKERAVPHLPEKRVDIVNDKAVLRGADKFDVGLPVYFEDGVKIGAVDGTSYVIVTGNQRSNECVIVTIFGDTPPHYTGKKKTTDSYHSPGNKAVAFLISEEIEWSFDYKAVSNKCDCGNPMCKGPWSFYHEAHH